MVRVKVCGIKNESDLKVAIIEGYNAVGAVINVVKSPRNVSQKKAYELFKMIPPFMTSVGVIVPNSIEDVLSIESYPKPDAIQIHGFFDKEFYESVKDKISIKIINSIPIDASGNSQIIDKDPIKAAKFLQKNSDAIMIDKYVPNKLGGTGSTFNWDVARSVSENLDIPLILSGGLNETNVVEAIRKVNPYAVDVSSGVEQAPGVKDPEKIKRFINVIKEEKL